MDFLEGADGIRGLIAALAAQDDGPQTLLTLCGLTARLTGVDGVGLSLLSRPDRREVVSAMGDWSELLEELQVTLAEGPCVDALAIRRPVLIPDLRAAEGQRRWTAFGPAAVAAGAEAVFAFPIQAGAIRVGALTLYRKTIGDLTTAQVSNALLLADATLLLVLRMNAVTVPGSRDPLGDAALDGRAEVHQATGLTAVHLEVDIDEAFVRLRAYAFATDRRLIDVAQDIVAGRLRLDREP